MPTYEFRCPDGHDFEKLYRTISGAASEAECPVCGKVGARRMSATGFAFKGSGFYLTDYGKNAHRGDGDAKSAGGKESSKAEGSSSESSSTAGESKGAAESKSSDSGSAPAPAAAETKKAEPKSEPKAAPAKPSASE